jgi:hypothetical protein
VVEQSILKRNRKGRPIIVRKQLASGQIEDYKVVYQDDKIVRLERMR